MTKNIAIIGVGGLGSNLAMLLLEQGYNIFIIDGDESDEKFFNRFVSFTGSRILNKGIPKVLIIKDVADRREYGEKISTLCKMITPNFDFNIFKNYDEIIICLDTVSGREMVERGLRKAGIENFFHVGCNLNKGSIFKTIEGVLAGEDPAPDAQTSYNEVPDARTYLSVALEVLDYIDPMDVVVYRE